MLIDGGCETEEVTERIGSMLTVSGKALGRKKPLFADFSVPPPEYVGDGAAKCASEGGSVTISK
jgi:hypothetical protein